jgi:hypothetical protein
MMAWAHNRITRRLVLLVVSVVGIISFAGCNYQPASNGPCPAGEYYTVYNGHGYCVQ